MTGLSAIRDALEQAAASRRPLMLGLDFDGTLAPLVRRPGAAKLPARTRRLLVRLERAPRVSLAVLSGRSLENVAARVGLSGVFYAGNHGLEIRGPGIAWTHPAAAALRGRMGGLARGLRAGLDGVPGVLVEDKGLTVSVHYRRTPTGHRRRVERAVREAAAPHAPRLALAAGKLVWEIRPNAVWDKGRALRRIARLRDRPRLVFIGDDRTDEEGFRTLGSRAITIRVGGAGPTAARFRVAGPAEVYRVLELAFEAVRSGRREA